MKLRLSLLAVFLATAAFLVVQNLPHDSRRGRALVTSSSETTPRVEPLSTFPRDSSLKLEVLRERTLAPYRLRPDRRLLLAVAEVRRLAGVPDSAVTARFAAGRWSVVDGSQQVGTLSELPDFPEMLELLTEWARKQAWAKGWSDDAGPDRPDLGLALDRLDAPSALRAADRAFSSGARDAALFRASSRAYAMLALEMPEEGEMADPIVARSLATLSYARALGADDPRREACLLADVMGYSAAASDLARKLSARDPLRLYVSWDDGGLERVAAAALETPSASSRLEAPFFRLLRLASRGDYEQWFSLRTSLEQQPGVPSALLLGTGLRIPYPEPSRFVAEQLLESLGAGHSARPKSKLRSQLPAGMGASLAQQVERIEVSLAQRPHLRGGPLFGAEIGIAQERAVLYAALDKVAQNSLEWLDPAEMTRWFAPGSPKSRPGKRAAAFQLWYSHLAQARMGKPNVAALRADVDSLAPGPAEAVRSYEALCQHLSSDDTGLRAEARELAGRMDSRPEHRVELATIAERDLLALSLAERMRASVAAIQGAADEPPALAAGPSLPDSVVGATLARKLAAHPTMWDVAQRYATWLEQRQDYAAARHVIEGWMRRSPADTGRTPMGTDARIQLARLHQLEGHPEQGLRLLDGLDRTGYFPVVERTALLDQDLGQTNQALAIAWAAHRQNPQLAAGRALLAELFWRQGRYGEAAKALHDGRPELSGAAWAREVAPRFVGVFRAQPNEGLEAAEALMRAGFNERVTLGAIPEALGDAGLHAFAFELQSRFRLTGAQQVESSLLAYGHLAAAKGEGAALQWIQGRVPEPDREVLGILAYQEHHPELLWSMAPARMTGEHGDYQWLLRAAACMTAGARHPRYAETADHVDQSRGTYHLEIAKYLLGLGEESEILALAQNLRQRSEIYYFIGLKNEQSGRVSDAADWYLMSVESGGTNNIESRWAMQQLRKWASEGRPADRAAPAPAPA